MGDSKYRFSTRAVHGRKPGSFAYDSITVPIVQTSTYTFRNTQALIEYQEERMFWSEPQRDEYGRYGNPTVRVCEQHLAALEGGTEAVMMASGMAAITTTLLVYLSPGDHLILANDCYRRTRQFCNVFLRRLNIEFTPVMPGDYVALEAAIRPNTRLIVSESPTNPFLRVADLERVAEIARRHNLRTVIDSTFATPFNLRPLEYDIDLVVHSATKYLAGHNDVLAGVVIGRNGSTTPILEAVGILGPVCDPHTAYLVLRGLKTLGLRMERHNATGLAVARYLEQHPKVRRVWYPGLPSHPDYELASQQMCGFGGVVSFELEADGPTTSRFVDALCIPQIAPSLGGTESLVEQPAIISYYDTAPEQRLALGIKDELVRLAIGIEDTEDIIADLEQALAQI